MAAGSAQGVEAPAAGAGAAVGAGCHAAKLEVIEPSGHIPPVLNCLKVADVVPLVEYTVKVLRQRPLAELANAVQQCIERDLTIRGHTILQLVVVEQNLVWQPLPFHFVVAVHLASTTYKLNGYRLNGYRHMY